MAPPPASLSTAAGGGVSRPTGSRLFRIRFFPCAFRVPNSILHPLARATDAIFAVLSTAADGFVYLLGPVLICLALAITSGLTWCFFEVILPMVFSDGEGGIDPYAAAPHVGYVAFVLFNILYNYFFCVTTSNKGKKYDTVVRELAVATDFKYPESPGEVDECRAAYEHKVLERARARRLRELRAPGAREQGQQCDSGRVGGACEAQSTVRRVTAAEEDLEAPQALSSISSSASSSDVAQRTVVCAELTSRRGATQDSPTAPIRTCSVATPPSASQQPQPQPAPRIFGWMLLGAREWGFCKWSNQPKPPRAHYDHVTKMLVLNMDHYCPWMFNTVGYFNYRYFCNFLFYVFIGMLYGAILTFAPFQAMSSPLYRQQIRRSRDEFGTKGRLSTRHIIPGVPTPAERTPVALSFMLCLSVGIAVLCLLGFHLYLLLTAQTTIEFHGNWANRRRAKKEASAG